MGEELGGEGIRNDIGIEVDVLTPTTKVDHVALVGFHIFLEETAAF